ncbi:MAG: iron-containing alcohol dehydrogenase [Leptospiraceae bacterium]|nr:iron-containing alcohol dehydrogenase [Leptospiraceae bacterium]
MPVLPSWVSYYFPSKIHLEIDCAAKAGEYVKNVGSRILIITTQKEMMNSTELVAIKKSIEQHTEGVIIYDDVSAIPNFKSLDTAAHFAKQAQINCILAYGSYESVNIAKVLSLLITNDLFADELVLGAKPPTRKPIPLVVIPTMPLMGLECSPFCFIQDDNDGMRKYFSHSFLFPELIICDPKIGAYMSASDTAKAGTSTMAAAIDTILSKFANEVTNSSALRAIDLVAKNLIPSIRDPKNINARNALYSASLLTGISQSVSSLGISFALSLATTSMTKLDIFQAMSIFLPHVMEYNLTSSASKYVMIARALDEDTNDISIIEAAIRAVEGVRKIYIELKIPQKLSEYEVKKVELPGIASMASQFSFLDCLVKELPKNEIETILVAAY